MADEVKDGADAGAEKKNEIKFNEDQQAFINGLINDAFERAFDKAQKKADEKVQALQAELEALKAAKPAEKAPAKEAAADPEAKPGKKKDAEPSPEAAILAAKLEEVTQIANSLKQQKDEAEARAREQAAAATQTAIKEEFIREAEKVGFFDTMDVYALVKGDLAIEDGSVVIMNPRTGQPRKFGSVDQNMTLAQFLSDFAKSKPHMVRHKSAAGGSGASESLKQDTKEKTDEVDYANMPRDKFLALTNSIMGQAYTRRD